MLFAGFYLAHGTGADGRSVTVDDDIADTAQNMERMTPRFDVGRSDGPNRISSQL